MAFDIYAAITDRIIAQLEAGTIPWTKPWVCAGSAGAAVSYISGKPYSLLNQMLLGRPGEYLSYKQCEQRGGQVRKGEKSQMVVFWKWLEEEDPETGKKKQIPFLRYYNVFHIDQCEGIKPRRIPELPEGAETKTDAEAIIEDYCARCGVRRTFEAGDRAFYRPATDTVTMPELKQFRSTVGYYETLFHELTHSTGHKSRLDRLEKCAGFGTDPYAKEELVAEIGAASILSILGMETEASFQNNAAYIASWLKALKNDKRMIVSAAGKAEKAIDLIMGRSKNDEHSDHAA